MGKWKAFLMRLLIILLLIVCFSSMALIIVEYMEPGTLQSTNVYAGAVHILKEVKSGWNQILHKLSAEVGQHGEEDSDIGGRGSGVINILLIGQDRRPGEESGRSDSMILCTFRPKDKTLVLTSFLRDLYVKIPGHGSNRINAAFRFGGQNLLKKTIASDFSVHIDGTVVVDFQQFAEIIDLLGGVAIDLRADEAEEINRALNVRLQKGTQTLTGEMALVYARIRRLDADGDFSRTDRQRKILSSLVQKVRNSDLKQLKEPAKKMLSKIDTDIGYLTALRIGSRILPMLKDMKIVSQQIPASGEFEGRMIDGMSVLVPDLEKTRKRLKDTLLP